MMDETKGKNKKIKRGGISYRYTLTEARWGGEREHIYDDECGIYCICMPAGLMVVCVRWKKIGKVRRMRCHLIEFWAS